MTDGEAVFRQIQNKARSDGAKEGRPTPTAEYLTRHALDSFLDRLTRAEHKDGFVLKGGILLATYGVRRPTKDVDAEMVDGDLTAERIAQVVRDIAVVDAADGLRFDLATISFQEIRDEAEYRGCECVSTATSARRKSCSPGTSRQGTRSFRLHGP